MIRILFVMSFLGGIAIVMISIETIRETNASTTETAVQDPSIQRPTQASFTAATRTYKKGAVLQAARQTFLDMV